MLKFPAGARTHTDKKKGGPQLILNILRAASRKQTPSFTDPQKLGELRQKERKIDIKDE